MKILIGVLISLIVLLLGGFFLYLSKSSPASTSTPPTTTQNAVISGSIGFNGTFPEGSTISVGQRQAGSTGDFGMFAQNLGVKDGVTWSFNGAKSNQNYDVQAFLMQDNKVIASSQILTMTAPATDEVLHINSDAGTAPAAQTTSTISGFFDLNGYYTTRTTITILQKAVGQPGDFQVAASGLAAKDGGAWSWGGALSDTTYQMKARFISSTGANIGESPVITVTAPASSEVFVLNSTAQPPAAPQPSTAPQPAVSGSVVSGTINFNGAAPSNSSIVVMVQQNGQYQVVVNGIQPNNGSTWSWNGGTAGQNYNMVAVLKQNNSNNTQTDVATSQTMNVTAPASNQVFNINSNVSLPAPSSGGITAVCGTKNQSNNTWSNTVSFPSVANAQSYWFQIGTTQGGNNLLNTNQGSQNNPSQTVNVTINDSTIYFAQYAYSNVANATWNSNSYSGFSGSYQFKCP